MAWFKYDQDLKRSPGDAYDKYYSPGTHAPYAGVYRCHGCGREVGIAVNHSLPPQNHHQHSLGDGAILWRLVVFADHRPSGQQV